MPPSTLAGCTAERGGSSKSSVALVAVMLTQACLQEAEGGERACASYCTCSLQEQLIPTVLLCNYWCGWSWQNQGNSDQHYQRYSPETRVWGSKILDVRALFFSSPPLFLTLAQYCSMELVSEFDCLEWIIWKLCNMRRLIISQMSKCMACTLVVSSLSAHLPKTEAV